MQMNPEPQDDMTGLLRAAAPRPGPVGPECLDEETIAAVVEGVLDPVVRAAATVHLASCARCRRAVAAAAATIADAAVAREVAAVEGRDRRRRFHIAIPAAAAAAVLLLLAWPRRVDENGPPSLHRAPTITAAATPVAVSPIGAVAEARMLRWTAVPRADRYRVTLSDAGGRVLYETELADTVAALPDSIVFVPGRSYAWIVEARTGWDRWATSPLVEFSIVAGAPPPR